MLNMYRCARYLRIDDLTLHLAVTLIGRMTKEDAFLVLDEERPGDDVAHLLLKDYAMHTLAIEMDDVIRGMRPKVVDALQRSGKDIGKVLTRSLSYLD